ncbi:hypothetical protein EDD18DRAFT_1105682 [Armillaria luteobubalina]|uniref:Uncharacterized protein n=1 Tax=Armillaria luteobubalina TaxID=153913 RepID=A0AA39Q5U4_9AGAR|nr:hypothetical protein EDD18DRAFT_1105682 [Armillaria luteobubalina]
MVQKYAEESMDTNPYHMSRITKLVKGSGDDAEELVFACTGVMCETNLPPIVRAPSVMVTGLGSASFDNVIAMLQEIKLTAEREFKHGMLDKWTPSTYQGFPAFTLSNRYFCAMKEGRQHKAVPFNKDVNPVGILQHLGKTDVVHTEDNVVQYFKAQSNDKGKCRFQCARPQLFRIGDVVKVQCSVIVFKAKGTRHQMKLVLRAIALLNCDISLDAKRKLNKLLMVEQSSLRRLKRKIGFAEDEVDEGVASKKACDGPTMDESTG